MRIGFVNNDVRTEKANYTTTHLALTALRRGHDVHYVGLDGFTLGSDDGYYIATRRPRRKGHDSTGSLLSDLQSEQAVQERVPVEEFDVLMLRSDPAQDLVTRPWASLAGVNFGRLWVVVQFEL